MSRSRTSIEIRRGLRSEAGLPLSVSLGRNFWRPPPPVFREASDRGSMDFETGSAGGAGSDYKGSVYPIQSENDKESELSIRRVAAWSMFGLGVLWLLGITLFLAGSGAVAVVPVSVIRDLDLKAWMGDRSAKATLDSLASRGPGASAAWVMKEAIASERNWIGSTNLGGACVELSSYEQVVIDGPAKLSNFVLRARRGVVQRAWSTISDAVAGSSALASASRLIGAIPGAGWTLEMAWWPVSAAFRALGRLSSTPTLVITDKKAQLTRVLLEGVALHAPDGADLSGISVE